MKHLITSSFVISVFLFVTPIYADNPIIQTNFTADPAPMVYNNEIILYTSHDEDVIENGFFTMKNWRCYSTSDMANWTDHGMAASLAAFKWVGTNGAWAPQCVSRDGKFYLYCPIQLKGIGVLVSDSPFGPFTDPIGKALISVGGGDIDPTVFIDSDGQAYLYWGNPDLYYVKLNKDMTSYSGSPVKVQLTVESFGARSNKERPTSYEEGPWFYKRNDLYYLVFAAGPISEHIGYSTSSSPTGPWKYRDVVMPSQGASFTNHPGVCDYKGNSYFFYHNGALPDGGGFHRSVCIEQFTYGADGSIPTMNMTKGPNQIGTLNPYDTIQAETICWESGVKTENCSEGGINVTSINNNDYIKVKGVNFGTGATSFIARVASISNANIELRLDSQNGTLVGTCAVSNTGGLQTWATKTCAVSGATGTHDLYFKFTGGSNDLFKFNWWKFIQPVNTIKPVSGKAIKSAEITVEKQSIKINFSQHMRQHNVNISLFNLNGRYAATLFNGLLLSSQLDVPFKSTDFYTGPYILKILTNNKSLLEQKLIIKM